MIQSGGIIANLLVAIPQAIFLATEESLKRGLKKGITLAKKAVPELAEKTT